MLLLSASFAFRRFDVAAQCRQFRLGIAKSAFEVCSLRWLDLGGGEEDIMKLEEVEEEGVEEEVEKEL